MRIKTLHIEFAQRSKLRTFDRVGCYCKFVAVIPGFSRRRISCS